MDLSAIYRSHPVSERNILARLRRQRISPSALTEWALAIDPHTDISDQNHPGGVQAVLELAAAARITAASVVVDVGAGLGGSARVLAQAFGCSVIAIEQDAARCQEGAHLTELVGLTDRVTFIERDALANSGGIANADVLWGQSAWTHFPRPDRFLDLWLPTLAPSGRVAFADAFLLEEPGDSEERRLVDELQQLWGAHLVPVDHWRRALDARACEIVHVRDRREEARAHFRSLHAVSSMWPDGTVTHVERRSWTIAAEALDRRLITMCELVALTQAARS